MKTLTFKKHFTLVMLMGILIFACVDQMPLPSKLYSPQFTAGDTTYLLINPIWDNIETPIEISIAQDGHVFVVDSAAHSIIVLDQNGEILPGFEAINNPVIGDEQQSVAPIDVDIDHKMNVLFIDGSQRVYRWNQLWNQRGIDSIAISAVYHNPESGDSTVLYGTAAWFWLANDPAWSMIEVEWSDDQATIDSLLAPHVIFDGALYKYNFLDLYYSSEDSRFSGISATDDESNYFYLTDIYHNRIIRVMLYRTHYLKLKTNEKIWAHDGFFNLTVRDAGTGAGTVNIPLSIDVDYNGNIYYSQIGDYFSVHKIKPIIEGGFIARYQPVFQPGVNDIMDLWDTTIVVIRNSVPVTIDTFYTRFSKPHDVAVDENQFVYVANTQAQEIQVFNSDGQFFKKAGIEEVIIDTTVWVVSGTDSVAIDTFFTRELKGILLAPQAVAVDKRGVIYICDTPTSRILRYRLSDQLDENLNPVQE